jgi:T-complex protein 1 subunit delta
MALTASAGNSSNNAFKDKEKPMAVRTANIVAARGTILDEALPNTY